MNSLNNYLCNVNKNDLKGIVNILIKTYNTKDKLINLLKKNENEIISIINKIIYNNVCININ